MAMIIWSGLGFLVAVIAFACLLVSELLVEQAFKNDQYYQTHGWPKLAALALAAGIVWLLGNDLNRKQSKRLVDPAPFAFLHPHGVLGRDSARARSCLRFPRQMTPPVNSVAASARGGTG